MLDRVEQVAPVEARPEFVVDQQIADAAHGVGHDESYPTLAELLAELAEHAGGRHVDVGDRRRLEHHEPQVAVASTERSQACAEPLRVRVEQRRIEAEHERPLDRGGAGNPAHVVEPRTPRHEPEHGVVRVAGAPQEVEE